MDKVQYKIASQFQSDSRYVTYRVQQEGSGTPALLKLFKSAYPTTQALKKFEQEFTILRRYNHPNIIKVQRIEPYENSIAMVLENIKGQNLSEIIEKGGCSLTDFFSIAIPLTDAVRVLHQQHTVHKNINPSNILIDADSGQPKLSGFSLATELSREAQPPNSREVMDTDLGYISPEQTGRINKSLDYRSDLYSLGALFYALLSSRPPFVSNDPMEMIHSHIARQVRPLNDVKQDIPEIISRICLRLLAKSADERYQSASGLIHDLIKCRDLYRDQSGIGDFSLGELDVPDQFRIPDKLYGRSGELDKLLSSFKRAAGGKAEIALIAGYSGVGKSRLVSEIKKVISQEKGYFISGKFDQFKRDVPLSSLLSAFRELILQILSESDEEIAVWKQKIIQALGTNGKLITDVIPETELLVGAQEPLEELPPTEANNRFNRVFSRFVKVFAGEEHPLCIFLDDLQWMDSATRQWIETQFAGEESLHFLLIGAYRDNEITPAHPLMLMLDRLRQHNIPVNEISLQPLDPFIVNKMVADTLVTTPDRCKDLSDLIYQKTNGNPFFSRQCLLALSESGAIYFNPENHAWEYILEKARNADISDNVVELMSAQIQKLPDKVQTLLKISSCIGNRFSIQLLNKVSGLENQTVAEQVEVAVQKGLLLPQYSWNNEDVEEYKFLHDRVQQAAYGLLSNEEKQVIRLNTGRFLLADATIAENEEKIYDIADHLNYAQSLIAESGELQRLAEVNLAASIRAKNATAYEPALQYILHAMECLPSSINGISALRRDLYLQRAECEHLNGNNETAEGYYDKAISTATDLLDKARVYQRKIHYYTNLRKFREAYNTGREAVRPLGVNLPANFFPPAFIKDLALYRVLIGRKKIRDIIHIKEMRDAHLQMAIRLMATFGRAAYQIKPQLCIAVCTRMVNICLKHGNTDGGFIGFLAFGPIFLGAILNRKQSGFDFGQLTLALVEKYKSQQYKAETHFVVGYFAMPWRRPVVEMEKYWQIAYEAGLEAGDFFHASCACCGTIQSYYMRGVGFDEIINTSDRYIEFLKHINNNEAILTIQSVRQAIRNLQGKTDSTLSFSTADFNEEKYLEELTTFNSRHFAHYYYINKMQVLYLHGEYAKAYELAVISDRYLKDSPGMLHTAEHFFYKSLIICALYPQANAVQRLQWKRYLKKAKERFSNYSKGCEQNFVHKSRLLEAEICRIEGDISGAQNFYYAAIELSARYGYTNIHGLANAIAAKFHYESNRRRLAAFHLQDAVYDYQTSGASAYANELIQRYPGLLDRGELPGMEQAGNDGMQRISLKKKTNNLDLSTVLKSSEAISREIRLKDLLTSLLRIIIENAGAEKMILLLHKGHRLIVQAECTTVNEDVKILPEVPLEQYKGLSKAVVNYVAHSLQPVILDEATAQGNFTKDSYFNEQGTRSVLCAPLVQQGKLTGIIYLENNLTNAAFTQERIDLLNLLSGQMAISLENALLYENLEEKVKERTRELNEEKDKSESLLLNILPSETAEELKRTGTARAKEFAQVTVLFTDFKNFTAMSERLNAQQLVSEINYCYSAFDNIMSQFGIEKIKTIGDSYMCAGGLPVEKATNPADTLKAAIAIRDFMLEEKNKRAEKGQSFFEIRIGLHTGPVVAGIVGTKKFAYDIWGDTVNIASRMESSGEPGKINISGTTYELIKEQFHCSFRGKIEAKNKGMIEMYFVENMK
ncbi:MAG: AAA family ATPase [Bacteroidetes bacterium]|nr:AAA family ATPase [Bacteroidota bacterium]